MPKLNISARKKLADRLRALRSGGGRAEARLIRQIEKNKGTLKKKPSRGGWGN